jgi:guanylate kinase
VDGVAYYFRTRREIEDFRNRDDYVVMDVRGDLQALDLNELQQLLGKDDVLFEGNPFVGRVLLTHSALTEVTRLGIFMSPLSRSEILYLRAAEPAVSLPELVTDVMRRKLLRRTRHQKGELSLKDLENIERRASSAYLELKDAHHFQYVIPNHDGEDSENWEAFYYPLGDARVALEAFVSLLRKGRAEGIESWEEDLVS